ncbi:tyrosine-type recombinase/integrase [Escherichia coli]|uniref:tyrosine-type recombinase/integrase n=1 Tax=Escherichia coli TaxID=562 RepID=UPI0021A88C8C|nr:tyrosine-type recombinase/integrase [Escherichia coli]UWU06387.1 tyrosine-type recombinase/integrase [Escherichia coli]
MECQNRSDKYIWSPHDAYFYKGLSELIVDIDRLIYLSLEKIRKDFVFINLNTDSLSDRAVKRARERYEKTNSLCDESFLKDLRFHDLRHEATSRLAEIFPMHELTKITGHKDPRMLMRYYHPKAEDLALKLK